MRPRSTIQQSAALAALLALAAASPSGAQQVISPAGFEFEDSDLYKPTVDPGKFFSIYDTTTMPNGRFSLGLVGDFAYHALSARTVVGGSEDTETIVETVGVTSVIGAVGLGSRFQLGVHLPIYVVGENDIIIGLDDRGGTHFNLGDFTVLGKVDLLGGGAKPFGLAIVPMFGLPTGNRREFAGLGDFSYGGLVAADVDLGPLDLAANFGGLIRDGFGGRGADDHFEDQWLWGLALSRQLGSVTLIGESYGRIDAGDASEFRSPVEILGGLRFPIGESILSIAAGGGVNDGKNAATFRFVFSVGAPVGDALPAGGAPAAMASSRKTYVVEDHDRNGQVSPGDVIVYTVNLMNGGAEPVRDVVVTDTIPENTDFVPGTVRANGLPMADASVYSASPPRITVPFASVGVGPGANQASLVFKVRIRQGLSAVTTIQNEATVDGSGIDEFELPPVETQVFPTTAQRESVVQTPTTAPMQKLEVTQPISFEGDGSLLLPESFTVLDQVASILQQKESLEIMIVGHVDRRPSEAEAVALTLARAEAVRSYLVAKGISATRLQTVGRGSSEPIASNDSEAGKATNRRIEFLIVRGG